MPKVKYVSKETILKAIKTERLKAGAFVQKVPKDGGFKVAENSNCNVCAVGAVLRHAGLNNKKIEAFGDRMADSGPITPYGYEGSWSYPEKGTIECLLNNKKYFHALSVKFEVLAEKKGCGKVTRKELLNFVEKNFPDKIKLNSNL